MHGGATNAPCVSHKGEFMTTSDCNTKSCITCNTEKPLTEFYTYTSNKKIMPLCKTCHRARNKKYQPLPSDRCGVAHQNEFIDILLSRGIYASPGKSSEYAHADVVAWGCVRIEVKFGESTNRHNPHTWKFRFTEKQANGGMVADLIAFMCPNGIGKGYTCYLIEPTCSELYRDGKFKPVLTVNIGTHRKPSRFGRGSLTQELLSAHLENWRAIEEKRLMIAGRYQQKTISA